MTSRDMQSETGSKPTGKIRLCIVMGGHWSVQMGGAQYQVQCILEELAKHPEFETYFLANVVPEQRDQGSYQIVRVGMRRLSPRFRMLPNLPSLYRALKRLRPDVVYQRELMPFTGACGMYCERHGARFVFHMAHDNDARHAHFKGWSPGTMRRRLERRIAEYGMKRADAIIAQTKDQAALLKAEYGLQAAAIVRNFHPVPDDDSPRRSADKLRVIWVANFKEWKHPELFVALAEALRDRSDVEFVMIGRPGTKAFAELHERMERLENLRYLGELHIDRVNEEISASHLFVNTSSSEGFANTFIQAWLRSVPVISCFVDPDECLSKGGAGLVAGSLEGLIAAVTDLADHRDKLERLAASARAYGYANHRPEQATALLDLLAGKPLQPG